MKEEAPNAKLQRQNNTRRAPLGVSPDKFQAPSSKEFSRWLVLAASGGLLVIGSYQALAAERLLSGTSGSQARVVVVSDPEATEAFRPRPEKIRAMVDRAITNLTEKATVSEAWRSLVSRRDVIGIKVFSPPGPNSGTRPAVVAAVVEGLLAAGIPPRHIYVWDKQTTDLRLSGFFDLAKRYGIRIAS